MMNSRMPGPRREVVEAIRLLTGMVVTAFDESLECAMTRSNGRPAPPGAVVGAADDAVNANACATGRGRYSGFV